MIPITDKTLESRSLEELVKIKKMNIAGFVVTSLLVLVLLYMFLTNTEDIPTLVIAICTSYLPILYISNLSKVNKAIKLLDK